MGIISLGLMFFVHNLGHCLFMINIGAMVLMYCFTLTEVRDLVSYWIGKSFCRQSSSRMNDGPMNASLKPDCARRQPEEDMVCRPVRRRVDFGHVVVVRAADAALPGRNLSYSYCAFVGLMIGVAGLFGDLVFSMIKRDIGVKDSGTTLPGHGGIIDRVDSLIFTLPIAFHLIRWKCF